MTTTATPTMSPAQKVLAAIANHFCEQYAWPTRDALLQELGPTHGLASILGSLGSQGWLRTEVVGSEERLEICLPDPLKEWFHDRSNVVELGEHLVSEHYYDADQLQRYYYKPQNWSTEWATYLALTEKAVQG